MEESDQIPPSTEGIAHDSLLQQVQILQQLLRLGNTSHSQPNDPTLDVYYLHPGENPGVSLISTTLTPHNYHTWERAMKLALKGKNKLKFVDGTITKPSPSDPHYAAWDKCNTYILSWLTRSLSPEIYQSVIWIDDCHQLWLDLKRRYHQGDIFRTAILQEELYAIKQGELSITNYFTKLKILWEELDSLLPIPSCLCPSPCTCGLGIIRGYRDNEYAIRFLRGLNEQYTHIRTQVMMMKPLPSINEIFSLLIEQERQLGSSSADSLVLFNNSDQYRQQQTRGSIGSRGRGRTTGAARGGKNPAGREKGANSQSHSARETSSSSEMMSFSKESRLYTTLEFHA